jgi:hypothetical protein
MLKIRFGRFLVPLWLVAILIGLGVAAAYYIYTLTIPLEVKEPLEVVSYPNKLSLYPGQTINFNVVIRNHASINYTVYLDFSLDNATYQNNYVEFSQEMYIVSPGENILKAWVRVEPFASPTNATLYVKILRGVISLTKIASGKIAYDSFSASNGTATDMPWTVMKGKNIPVTPIVEDGKLKMVSDPETRWINAWLTNINVTDFVFEVKVKPMMLTHEGPEVQIVASTGEEEPPTAAFDYYHKAHVLRIMIGSTGFTTYQTKSFTMFTNTWYTIKMVVSRPHMKIYLNNDLVFDVTDSNIAPCPSQLRLTGFESVEWGYWDDVKIWKSNLITIYNLREGQKIELYDNANNLKLVSTVRPGENKAILDVSTPTFPFKGYFKIYASDGVTTLCITPLYDDIWGGDEYTVNIGS